MELKLAASSVLLSVVLLAASSAAHAGSSHAHWGYGGQGAPEHWGDLEPGFAACKTGKEQSPIDIQSTAKKSTTLKSIAFDYKPSAVEVVNNGHTIQINLTDGGTIKLGKEATDEFKLLQFHFHTPSEEYVDGRPYPLVAHLVHKSESGSLAVVGVLFKLGKENTALKEIFKAMPEKAGATVQLGTPFNAAALLPRSRQYYAFKGSLTTPPCSEGVRWQVLKQPVEISAEQLAAFKALYPLNARPVQPLHGREVRSSN